MKIINHPKDKYILLDGTVMRGTIIMTQKEWKKAIDYLQRTKDRAVRMHDTYTRDNLVHLFSHEFFLSAYPPHTTCLGVCATKLIVAKFYLPRYKEQNYQVVIKN